MTYDEALDYLASAGKFGINLGLARINKLLDLMNRPEKRFKTVHITGTNGKGSTTAMVAAILQSSGIRTAMYTSPHLTDYTERMKINGEPVSRQAFAGAIEHVSTFVEQMTMEGFDHPTEFEIITAAAFYYFAAAGVEYAVIEVGLGGLLDSTNVITPEIAVITNVSLEHTDRCGETITEIAVHKAGIIKQGVPVVTTAKSEALNVIYATAERMHASLYSLDRDFSVQWRGTEGWGQKVTIRTSKFGNIVGVKLNLLGNHQLENCAAAVMAAKVLAEKEARITNQGILTALGTVRWPGRFEVFPGQPLAIVDGAHNPDGATALRRTLDELISNRPLVFVLGILRDKDVSGIIRALIRPGDKVVTVRPDSERAADCIEIAREIGSSAQAVGEVEAGIEQAIALAGPQGVVCIAGSLYLVGQARRVLLSRQK